MQTTDKIHVVIRGEYNHHKTVSQNSAGLVPCSDMCGTIIGSASKKFSTGERVLSIFNQTHITGQVVEENMASGLGLPTPGVLTEYRVFSDYGLVKTPDYLSDEQASTLAIAAVTSWMSINWNQPIGDHLSGKDRTVLLQGTGGVSIAGLQIAKACGMKSRHRIYHHSGLHQFSDLLASKIHDIFFKLRLSYLRSIPIDILQLSKTGSLECYRYRS